MLPVSAPTCRLSDMFQTYTVVQIDILKKSTDANMTASHAWQPTLSNPGCTSSCLQATRCQKRHAILQISISCTTSVLWKDIKDHINSKVIVTQNVICAILYKTFFFKVTNSNRTFFFFYFMVFCISYVTRICI